jgi:hypothetical protein
MFEKKNLCRDFSIGKIISWCVYYIYIYNYKVQFNGVPESWKISISIMF